MVCPNGMKGMCPKVNGLYVLILRDSHPKDGTARDDSEMKEERYLSSMVKLIGNKDELSFTIYYLLFGLLFTA